MQYILYMLLQIAIAVNCNCRLQDYQLSIIHTLLSKVWWDTWFPLDLAPLKF